MCWSGLDHWNMETESCNLVSTCPWRTSKIQMSKNCLLPEFFRSEGSMSIPKNGNRNTNTVTRIYIYIFILWLVVSKTRKKVRENYESFSIRNIHFDRIWKFLLSFSKSQKLKFSRGGLVSFFLSFQCQRHSAFSCATLLAFVALKINICKIFTIMFRKNT